MTDSKSVLLDQIAVNVKNCSKCGLCKTATNGVPGEGNVNAELMFIGEAPGQQEDLSGRPFVGRAGKMLEKLLEAIHSSREEVFIGNIIKHRPPQNRDPLPNEIAACTPYLDLQLKIINPVLIVTLGRFAMNFFYPEGKITRDHGSLIKLDRFFIYPVYHPAAALRNTNFAKALALDFVKIPSILEEVKNLKNAAQKEENFLLAQNENQLGLGL